ncbi:MAG: glycosyltransferase [Hyphomicrobiales bacterium]|nr:glycosyltransferase [Hyphomicrobiales bacterium]
MTQSPNTLPPESGPLAGRTVAVVHAAWHSCGSYQVNVAQAQAYRAMGAHVISLALREWPPGALDEQAPHWRDYIAKTQDMPAHERFYSNMPRGAFADPRFWAKVYWPLIHGDHARATAAMTALAPIPPGLAGRRIDLIHCNHFFCMPAARNLSADAPLIVETQDIQANQYDLRNKGAFVAPPRATYAQMLDYELDTLRKADLLVHLNAEECAQFEQLLPEKRHALVYPAAPAAPTGPGGRDIVIVASGNHPNTLGVEWFLQEVAPLARGVDVKIAGNVDAALKQRNPQLYARCAGMFLGRVADIGAVYANAGLVLLPTTEGHGLSIKAVEALSSGAPLIATSQAFRGMNMPIAAIGNLLVADDPATFAAALRAAALQIGEDPRALGPARAVSDTRRYYEDHFSAAAYRRALQALAVPMARA